MRTRDHHPLLTIVPVVVGALMGSRTGLAADIHWVGTQADCTGVTDVGSFFHDDNWLNFAHPEAPDTALFGSGIDPDPPDNPTIVFFGDACLQQGICPNETNLFGGTAVSEDLHVVDGNWTFDFNTLTAGCFAPPGLTTGNYTVTITTFIGTQLMSTGASGVAEERLVQSLLDGDDLLRRAVWGGKRRVFSPLRLTLPPQLTAEFRPK